MPVAEKDAFEQEFWGNCTNTLGEEIKQTIYMRCMGLRFSADWRSEFNIDMDGKSVIDIGGGPVSLLLKCSNVRGLVIDPLPYPDWVHLRYEAAGIASARKRGEDLTGITGFDEAWIYNVLQHVDDPGMIIENARHAAKTIRLFEWINIRPYKGHPHMLTEGFLSSALGGPGKTEWLNESGCQGQCFYGVFRA